MIIQWVEVLTEYFLHDSYPVTKVFSFQTVVNYNDQAQEYLKQGNLKETETKIVKVM